MIPWQHGSERFVHPGGSLASNSSSGVEVLLVRKFTCLGGSARIWNRLGGFVRRRQIQMSVLLVLGTKIPCLAEDINVPLG
jgi:hypothetical protein